MPSRVWTRNLLILITMPQPTRPLSPYYQCDKRNYTDRVLDLYYLINMNIYTETSGQYIYVTGLCNFFFAPQDLVVIINSLQRIAFQRNLVLIGFYSNTLHHKFFLMKISSPHWNGTAHTYKERLWRKIASEYQMS